MFGLSSEDEDNANREEARTNAVFYKTLREANVARQKEWDPDGHSNDLDWRANELGGEIGEVCNVLKKLHRQRLGLRGSRVSMGDLADELADGVICLDLFLMSANRERASVWEGNIPLPKTLPAKGKRLFVVTGRLLDGGTGVWLPSVAGLLQYTLAGIAADEGIDLGRMVSIKFNKTTEKYGLTTMLEDSYRIEG